MKNEDRETSTPHVGPDGLRGKGHGLLALGVPDGVAVIGIRMEAVGAVEAVSQESYAIYDVKLS